MSFTEDELLTLKKLIDDPQASGFFTEDMARRLIGRLEAAESLGELAITETVCNCIASPSGHSIFDAKCIRCKRVETWLRSKGESK